MAIVLTLLVMMGMGLSWIVVQHRRRQPKEGADETGLDERLAAAALELTSKNVPAGITAVQTAVSRCVKVPPGAQSPQRAGNRGYRIHPSKRFREMRRANCRQRSSETVEPTADELDSVRVIVVRHLSSEPEDSMSDYGAGTSTI